MFQDPAALDWRDYVFCRDLTIKACRWCRGPIGHRGRVYCCPECAEAFSINHFWGMASWAALKRADYRCEICASTRLLEVHHKVPLEGGYRNVTCLNHQANLIALCHDCHQRTHFPVTQAMLAAAARLKREQARQAERERLAALQPFLL